ALLFRGSVYGRRDNLTMPMYEFRNVGIVEQVDGRGDALAKADEGSGDGSVVSERVDRVPFRDIRQYRANAREIGRTARSGLFSSPTLGPAERLHPAKRRPEAATASVKKSR